MFGNIYHVADALQVPKMHPVKASFKTKLEEFQFDSSAEINSFALSGQGALKIHGGHKFRCAF